MVDKTDGRDLRIDFFRGFAMFSIFIAHVPSNAWSILLPRHYGPSDAADVFVFCSGFASAIAFGAVFTKTGFFSGLARVLYRSWQIYWAHIGMFLVTAALCVLANQWLGTKDYLASLNIEPFFNDATAGLVGLLTLTYVPNYFDILPMYLVMLITIPAVLLLRRIGVAAVIAVSLILWMLPKVISLNLPAEWWSDRGWFFNPFAWQLMFVTAFAFGLGWLKVPPPRRWLIILASAYVLVMIPLSNRYDIGWIWDFRDATWAWAWQKSQLGLFRLLHILALAYLLHCFVSARGGIFGQSWTKPFIQVGQHALPVFVVSIVGAQAGGMLLDMLGRNAWSLALVNVSGLVFLYFVARIAAYYKRLPWQRHPAAAHVIHAAKDENFEPAHTQRETESDAALANGRSRS